MNGLDAIREVVLRAGMAEVTSVERLPGGCIQGASRIELSDGRTLVAKICPEDGFGQLQEESGGLTALASVGAVLTPQLIGIERCGGFAILLMSWLEPVQPTSTCWARLGRDLAVLHQTPVGDYYGFDHDNHIGSTRQINTRSEDWVEFNSDHRLGFQLELAEQSELLTPVESGVVRRVMDDLDRLIPRQPLPALLHGDLWSGNAIPTCGDRVGLIDPAVYFGDGWADIAMMRLFGGFPDACFDAYERQVEDKERQDTRILVYQLYHLLNHINLFGRVYAGQALGVARRLLSG